MDLKSIIPFGRSSAPSRRDRENDPFEGFRREMDRLFDTFARNWDTSGLTSLDASTGSLLSPRVNVAETEDGLEITAELPGLDAKDIQLDLADGVLTLKGERKFEKEERDERKQYHLVERGYGTFLRRFAVPFEPDQERLDAHFDKGVLKIRVPRSAAAEKRKTRIPIKGN